MNKYFIKYLVLLLITVLPGKAFSQITSPEAIYSESTNYTSGTANDPIFYFSNINAASLVISMTGTTTYTFNWYRYNQANNRFDIHLNTETGTSSSISGLTETGYRVTADDGAGNIDTYTCWALQPEMISADMEMLSESCYQLELGAIDSVKVITYYDTGNGAPLTLDYGRTYTWSSIPESNVSDETDKQITFDAPVEDTDFSVTVGSKFGLSQTASMHYLAIAVKAGFTQKPESREIENEMDTTQKHSAPLVVRFYSNSTKGNNLAYEWTFGDDGKAFEPNPIHTYQIAGTYNNFLYVINEVSGCEDTSDPQEVVVFESELLVPNVFTPNGDGVNDEFKVAYRSLKQYNIMIYNRWGRKVYSSDNPALGWNGRIGKGEAAPGVYFYVINAKGYLKNEKYKLHGTITLIRGK